MTDVSSTAIPGVTVSSTDPAPTVLPSPTPPPPAPVSAPTPTPTPTPPVVVVPKPVGPRGINTTELYAAAIVGAAVVVAMALVLVFSPDATTRKTVLDYVSRLVALAISYVVSRGVAKFAQGTTNGTGVR